MSQRIFTSDCEGPLSKNDNAFEVTGYYIPNGDELFKRVSKYDDVLADIVKRPNYKAGDTLRLILPFLKAYGANNRGIKEFSSKNISLVPGVSDTLRFVSRRMPSFIVSTSYEQYISAICDVVGFPFENTYCTKLNIDKYHVSDQEIRVLKELKEEICDMPLIEIPDGAKSVNDFSKEHQELVKRLDEIFWVKLPRMESYKMIEEVNPIGGSEKANAVIDIARRLEAEPNQIAYFGDSITDVEVYQLIKNGGGLTVSFNGNSYAIREAEVAVLSANTIITSVLADVFNRFGKEGVIDLVKNWSYHGIQTYSPDLFDKVHENFSDRLPQVELITDENRDRLAKESSAFRKTVRGEKIGKLG